MLKNILKSKEANAAVVEHRIEDHLNTMLMGKPDQSAHRFLIAKMGINCVIIYGIVLMVTGRFENRGEVNYIHSQIHQVIEAIDDSLEIAALLAVRLWPHVPRLCIGRIIGGIAIGKALREDLIDHRTLGPLGRFPQIAYGNVGIMKLSVGRDVGEKALFSIENLILAIVEQKYIAKPLGSQLQFALVVSKQFIFCSNFQVSCLGSEPPICPDTVPSPSADHLWRHAESLAMYHLTQDRHNCRGPHGIPLPLTSSPLLFLQTLAHFPYSKSPDYFLPTKGRTTPALKCQSSLLFQPAAATSWGRGLKTTPPP